MLSPDELEARLKAIGAERYHNRHPFHLMMNEGALNSAKANLSYTKVTSPIDGVAGLAKVRGHQLEVFPQFLFVGRHRVHFPSRSRE